MEDLGFIEVIVRTGTFVLALWVFVVTWFIRSIVETLYPHLRKKADENAARITYTTAFARWWNKVILYAIPVVLGSVAGLTQLEFLFGPMSEEVVVCVMFGGGVGWSCSYLYKALYKGLAQRLGVSDSIAPPGV